MYREGIVTDKKTKLNREGCFVNVGLLNEVFLDKPLTHGVRVTVRIEDPNKPKKLKGTAVSPTEPTLKTGVYWGYSVRIANTLSDVFTKSPYEGGYDAIIGTSDRGDPISSIDSKSLNYNHALIVFGGLKGLEAALENDDKLDVEDPKLLFEHYLNALPDQGSRTIRTEEAILVTLSALSEKLSPKVPRMVCKFNELLPQSSDTS
ncbi:C9orf114.2 family protein [Megaselia abdita]